MAMTPEQRSSRIAQRKSQFQGKQLKVHVLKGVNGGDCVRLGENSLQHKPLLR